MAIVTDLVTAIESRKFSLSVVYSSVWRKTVWSSMDIWRSSMDDLHGRRYRPRETSLIKSSIIVHVHYSFLGDSWSKLLCWLWTMPLDELELD